MEKETRGERRESKERGRKRCGRERGGEEMLEEERKHVEKRGNEGGRENKRVGKQEKRRRGDDEGGEKDEEEERAGGCPQPVPKETPSLTPYSSRMRTSYFFWIASLLSDTSVAPRQLIA